MRISQAAKVEIRAALIREGARLFAEQGFSGTTVDEITVAAGIAKGTFYNYFPTKEDLAVAVVLSTQQQIGPALLAAAEAPEPIGRRLLALYAHSIRWITANGELSIVWAAERVRRGRVDGPSQLNKAIARAIEVGQQSGELRIDRLGLFMAGELEGIFLGYIVMWYHTGQEMDLLTLMEHAINAYLDGARHRA